MTTPDVSVIVPVYNALPFLTECLTSLVAQSIGSHRMEIIAVDDGSTDGSGKELARFAQSHPGLFTVVHQANSGGPGRPCNRGLEAATGRYVYFVGSDDYLWDGALERLVAEADEYGSDVVAGKMVGVNGRYVHQAFYARTDHDVQLYASELPWSMSNAKLFRRELVERHGLRFPEDLPVNSDQAFTLEACIHARRISVLADDSYYFALRRTDSGNITYRTRPGVNLACATDVMRRAADLIEAGPNRDAILRRHFAWELFKVLTVSFLELDEADQRGLCRGVADLADAYLTDAIRDGLTVRRRLVLSLAQAGEVDLLREVVRQQAEPAAPPLLLEGDRAYVRYAGFRESRTVDDRWYEVLAEGVSRRLTDSITIASLGWSGRRGSPELAAAFRVAAIWPADADPSPARVRAVPGGGPAAKAEQTRSCARSDSELVSPTSVEPCKDGLATTVHARVPVGPLLAYSAARWTVALCLDVAGRQPELPLPADTLLAPTIRWQRGHIVRLSTTASTNGRLQLVVQTASWRAVARRLKRTLPVRVGRK